MFELLHVQCVGAAEGEVSRERAASRMAVLPVRSSLRLERSLLWTLRTLPNLSIVSSPLSTALVPTADGISPELELDSQGFVVDGDEIDSLSSRLSPAHLITALRS